LSSEFFIPLRLLGSLFHVSMNGMAASDKIFDLLDQENEKEVDLTEKEKESLKDINIKFADVTFSYDKERIVLNHINLHIKNKKMIALVGESGCGKSTIANLLLKLKKVDEGEITLNGLNINDIPFNYLRNKIGIISHNSYIFNGTIEDNLRMGKYDASNEEIKNALENANLYDFVMGLPCKLKTNVGEGGALLSGGQKQRLALARIILSDPEIIIFDEATSNIDVESEEKIWKSIYEIAENKTVILISHRLANVKNADTIYVLDKGNMVEWGSHSELMNNRSKYYNLLKHQEELESIYMKSESSIKSEVAVSE
ncbi:ABC transporter ATP-binding protein/permease, partial [Vallitalea guaymasensis]|uniref:ABC transporter ATP-binding protein/permease n=1 Tax=Vallitalea guaymasensis TaxID=1185412 RepID=UPI002729E88F